MILRPRRGLRALLLRVCLMPPAGGLLAQAQGASSEAFLLYGDHPAPGSEMSVTGRRSQAGDSRMRPYEGGGCLRVLMDREEDSLFSMTLIRAWISERRPHPGDLSAQRAEGALAFWLRAPGGLEGLELGLGEEPSESVLDRARKIGLRPEETLEVEPRVSLSLSDYAKGGAAWERVVVPLRDFSSGYYLWMDLDRAGGTGGRVLRKDWPFHWKSVGSLFLWGPAFHGILTEVFLDRVEILPRCRLEELDRRKKRMAFSRGHPESPPPDLLLFGDKPASPFWAFGGRLAEVVVDQTQFKEGKASALFRMTSRNGGKVTNAPSRKGVARPVTMDLDLAVETEDSWAGMSLPETDLRPFVPHGALRFWVKGKNGGEGFALTLGSRMEGVGVATAESPDVRRYGDVSGDWRLAWVPLVDFRGEGSFDWGRVVEVGFHAPATNEMELAWWLDDLRMVSEGDLEGIKIRPEAPEDEVWGKGPKPWER